MDNETKYFLVIIVVIVIFTVLFGIALLTGQEERPKTMIYSDSDIEIWAQCTVDSGIIVTQILNARIAGDHVATQRMTPGEYQTYCGGEE